MIDLTKSILFIYFVRPSVLCGSSLVYRRLLQLRQRYPRIPLTVFVEDVAASGAFYIACAANEIVVDASSVVGSVGVVAAGWGYTKVMKKYGVERRVMT